jgi:hypothetical protein
MIHAGDRVNTGRWCKRNIDDDDDGNQDVAFQTATAAT